MSERALLRYPRPELVPRALRPLAALALACGPLVTYSTPIARARAPVSSAVAPGPGLLRAPAPAVPQLSVSPPFRAAPLLVSGTDAYRDGEYLYQDYLFDDHGADTAPGLGSSATWGSSPLFAPVAGDVFYPSARRFHNDAADLVELRIKPTPRAIVYRVTLNAPSAPGTVVAGIGINTGRRVGPPVPWPFGAAITSPGLDWFITAWGTGAAATRLADGHTTKLPAGAVRMDARRAQMTISVPRAIIDPRRATWRYVAGTGLWDGHRWTPLGAGASAAAEAPVSGSALFPAPAVFNLAFRFHEPVALSSPVKGSIYTTAPGVGSWFEDGQARELAAHTTGQDFADVDFAALARHQQGHEHAPGRVQARIYPSRLSIPPGVDHGTFPEFGGALQPYLVRLPPGYRTGRRTAVLFALHGSNSGYQLFNVFMPHWGQELGDARGSLVVTPLGRGLDGPDPNSAAFTGALEADFFETWADLARHFTLDPSRISVGGYSAGAYGAYALAETWPDLFTNVFSVVGAPPSNGINTELLGNLRWVPVMAWNQADDSQVPYTEASAAEAKLTALGLRHVAWTFPAGGHLGPALRDDWRQAQPFLDGARLVRDPPRIDLGIYPALDYRRYGLLHDHAYWLSHLRVTPGQPRGALSARSLAFGLGDAAPVGYYATGSSGRATAAVHGVRWRAAARHRPANALALSLDDLSALRVDGRRARLRGKRGLTVWVRSNARVRIRLDLRICPGARVRISGPSPSAVKLGPRAIAIGVRPGLSTVRIVHCRKFAQGRILQRRG